MVMGMGEPAELFCVIFFLPVEFTAGRAYGKRRVEIDQNIRLGNDLPHGLHVGMFLRDMPAGIAMFFKFSDKG